MEKTDRVTSLPVLGVTNVHLDSVVREYRRRMSTSVVLYVVVSGTMFKFGKRMVRSLSSSKRTSVAHSNVSTGLLSIKQSTAHVLVSRLLFLLGLAIDSIIIKNIHGNYLVHLIVELAASNVHVGFSIVAQAVAFKAKYANKRKDTNIKK